MKNFPVILLALAAFAGVNLHAQKSPGLALTPPMGWNSWNKFGGDINEDLIRQTADAMATNGRLAGGGWAMCVLNRGTKAQAFSFDWKNEAVSDSFSRHFRWQWRRAEDWPPCQQQFSRHR